MMRWSLILLCLLAALCRAGTPVYLPVGTLINTTMPRDRPLAGTPLTEWGPETKGGWHTCGFLQGNCNNTWYLQPMNATGQIYTENGRNYTIYRTSDPQIGVVYEVRDTAGPWEPANGSTKYSFYTGPAAVSYTSYVRVKLVYLAGHNSEGTAAHTVRSDVMIGTSMTNAEAASGAEDYYLQVTTFNLTAQTCTYSASAGGQVSLGNLLESEVEMPGYRSKEIPFSLSYSCPANISVKAIMTDLLHPENQGPYLWMNKNVVNAAEGVMMIITGVQPQTGVQTSFSMSAVNKNNILTSTPVPQQGALQLYAQVIRMGPVKAGKMNALLGITLIYE